MDDRGSGPGEGTRLADEEPLSAREALSVVADQRHRVTRSVQINVALVHGAWGVAWLTGFGIFYFTAWHGSAGRSGSGAAVPFWLAIVVIAVMIAIAIAATAGQTIRRGRGIEGPSWEAVRMYMWAWPVALAGTYVADAGLMNQGLPGRLAPLLWPGTGAAVVGVMYLAGGMLFRDRIEYGLGAWILLVAAASMFAGVPDNFAVLALAGGSGFGVAAWRYAVLRKRAPE